MRFLFLLLIVLTACEKQEPSGKTVSGINGDFWVYETDDSTGEAVFQVFSFYSNTGTNEVTVWNRYYPDSNDPDYFWSGRTGGPFEFKVEGSKVDFTYHYCLTLKTCKASCSDTSTCEEWKTESYTGSGSLDDVVTFNANGRTFKFYNETVNVIPIPKFIDSTQNLDEADEIANGESPNPDANHDPTERFFPNWIQIMSF